MEDSVDISRRESEFSWKAEEHCRLSILDHVNIYSTIIIISKLILPIMNLSGI